MNINKKNQMKNNKKTLNYKKKHNKLNRILVVSTMSSGKSTLIKEEKPIYLELKPRQEC